jgi:ribonuclease P protein component
MESPPQLLKPLGILRTGQQFRAVYSKGLRFHTPYFSAFILPTDSGELRFGITATRKLGKAVVRNRCKRRIREILHKYLSEDFRGIGCDLVINAKPELATADFKLVIEAFERTLRRFQSSLARKAEIRAEPDTISE